MNEDEKKDKLARVEFYVELENYGEALILLRQMETADPENLSVLCKLASCLLKIGEFEEARDYLAKAEKIDPNNIRITLLKEQLNEVAPPEEGAHVSPSPLQTPHFEYKNKKKHKAIRKKVCPNCNNDVEKSSKICGYCGHHFRKDVIKQIAIMFVLVVAIAYSFSIVVKYIFHGPQEEAEIQNLAGENGQIIEISNLDWECYGNSIIRNRGKGYSTWIEGKLKNASSHTLDKVNISIHLWGKTYESTFTWIDLYNLNPSQVIAFSFPNVLSPYYAYRCEIRINEILLSQNEETTNSTIDIYTPNSNHFSTYTFLSEDGKVIKEKEPFAMALRKQESSPQQRFWNVLLFLRYLLFSFLSIFIAAKLVDWVEPNPYMIDDTKTRLVSSAAFAAAMVGINLGSRFVLALIPGFIVFLGNIFFFFLKIFLFFFFFKKEFLQTLFLIIFYFCTVLFFESFTQWVYNLLFG